MRRSEETPLDPEIVTTLEAIDATLADRNSGSDVLGGLTDALVFGRLAGQQAAQYAGDIAKAAVRSA